MTYVASLFAFSLMSGVAQADFNAELNGSVIKADDLKVYAVGGSYYFEQVSTNKGPLAEASFLDKQSSVDAVFSRWDFDGGNINAWGVGGTYVMQGTGLYLNAAVAHVNGYSEDSYSLGGGYYLSHDWTVSVDTEFDEDLNYQGFSLGSKKLFNLGSDNYINLEGSYTNPDEGDDSFTVSSDYYFNQFVSLGLGYEWADSFSDGVSSVRGQWFVNDKFAVSAEVAYVDVSDDSETTYMLGATMRF